MCVCGPVLAAPFSSSLAELLKVARSFASVGGKFGQFICPGPFRHRRRSVFAEVPLFSSPFEACGFVHVGSFRLACEPAAPLSISPPEPLNSPRSGAVLDPGPFLSSGCSSKTTGCTALLASFCAASVEPRGSACTLAPLGEDTRCLPGLCALFGVWIWRSAPLFLCP